MPNIEAIKKPIFLISGTKKAFNNLEQRFTKALILQHFDLKSYIKIQTNLSGYAIDRILS